MDDVPSRPIERSRSENEDASRDIPDVAPELPAMHRERVGPRELTGAEPLAMWRQRP